MVRVWQLAMCVGLFSAPLANAQVLQTAPNLNAAIADHAYNGTLASMTCVTMAATTGSATVATLKVTIYLDHTWIGDLTLKLVSPANSVVTLMSRPGFVDPADDGTGGPGDSSNLIATSPIDFVLGAIPNAEQMGATLSDAQAVCRDDGLCTYAPNNGSAPAGTLSNFNGQTIAGVWKFCAGDSATGDTGAIQQVRLKFNDGIFTDGFGG